MWFHRCCTCEFYLLSVGIKSWVVVLSTVRYNHKKCIRIIVFWGFVHSEYNFMCYFSDPELPCLVWNFKLHICSNFLRSYTWIICTRASLLPVISGQVQRSKMIKSIGEEALREDLMWMLWFTPLYTEVPFSSLAIWVWTWRDSWSFQVVFLRLAGSYLSGGWGICCLLQWSLNFLPDELT